MWTWRNVLSVKPRHSESLARRIHFFHRARVDLVAPDIPGEESTTAKPENDVSPKARTVTTYGKGYSRVRNGRREKVKHGKRKGTNRGSQGSGNGFFGTVAKIFRERKYGPDLSPLERRMMAKAQKGTGVPNPYAGRTMVYDLSANGETVRVYDREDLARRKAEAARLGVAIKVSAVPSGLTPEQEVRYKKARQAAKDRALVKQVEWQERRDYLLTTVGEIESNRKRGPFRLW